ncbi:sensor histidine kinase [Nitrospina watsonii]|uniref:histidine kinase n=1 Tax=Nitrospina watsonii TaxID=1323948 RepID=A0ABN8VYM9_9BACT|nr:PAS domain-containing sensor histidine kinase [Nitrospina watsonii]CAI2717203.1 Putative Histidine kinase [Nitrospina watsonii]
MEKFKQYIKQNLSEVIILSILLGVVAINYFIYSKIAFLDMFYLLAVLAGYYIGRRFAVLGAFLAILLVWYFLLANQDQPITLESRFDFNMNMTVWASFLILAAWLIGTLTENLRKELKESNRLREDMQRDRVLLNITNARLNEYTQHLEAKVADRTRELEQNNKDLQNFAAIASHDLKEPLRKIVAYSEMIEQQQPEIAHEIDSFLQRMRKAVTRMENLIDGLMKLCRVTQSVQLLEETDLNRVLREVVQDLEVRVIETKAEIKVNRLPVMNADPFQMQLLFRNLISNSLKYCRSDTAPKIAIGVFSEDEDDYEFYVEDNGIGIPRENMGMIFEPFERLHSRDKVEGSGIGLAICRQVVDRHKGELKVESEVGRGTRFIIRLPKKEITRVAAA